MSSVRGKLASDGVQGDMSTVLGYEEQVEATAEVVSVTYRFVDTSGLEAILLGDLREDVAVWPEPSPRPTTPETARALEQRSTPDPEPRLPELEINDGLGL